MTPGSILALDCTIAQRTKKPNEPPFKAGDAFIGLLRQGMKLESVLSKPLGGGVKKIGC